MICVKIGSVVLAREEVENVKVYRKIDDQKSSLWLSAQVIKLESALYQEAFA
jgi:hypothetical protein